MTDHKKVIADFDTMVKTFRSFAVDAATATALMAAIRDLENSNRNLTDRNSMLRQRPDLPVDRIPAHQELVRLQELETRLNVGMDDTFFGLYRAQVEKWQRDNGGLMSRAEFAALCSLALAQMETFRDDRGVSWVPPTAYAYANACRALHNEREKRRACEAENDRLRAEIELLKKSS